MYYLVNYRRVLKEELLTNLRNTICSLSAGPILARLEFQFDVKTCPTTAPSLRLGVGGDPEPSSDQLHVVVDGGTLEILQRRLIHHHSSSVSLHQHVLLPSLATLLKVQLVLEPGASSALDRHPQPSLKCSTELQLCPTL